MSGAFPPGPAATPNWLPGYVPPAAEWNQWWSRKIDVDDPSLLGGPFLPLTGGTMEGQLTLAGPPLQPLDACTKAYADSLSIEAGPFMPQSGGTFTGLVTLASAFPPTGLYDAVTKQYADAIQGSANNATTIANNALTVANNALPRSGGVMTGYVTLAGDPPQPLMAATKQYVDNNFLRLTGGTVGTLNVGNVGINYTGFGGNRFAFNWDGSFILGYVNGNYIGQLASVAWVQGNYTSLGQLYGNYYPASTTDGRYLYKTGDTCTGGLTVNGALQGGSIMSFGNIYVQNDTGAWFGAGGSGRVLCFWAGAYYWDFNNSNGTLAYMAAGPGNPFWVMRNDGLCLNYRSSVAGNGAYWDFSDERFKENVAEAQAGLAAIRALRPITFRRRPTEPVHEDFPIRLMERELGFSAQQVREAIPEAVTTLGIVAPDDLGVSTTAIVAALVNAVREMADRLDALTQPAMRA